MKFLVENEDVKEIREIKEIGMVDGVKKKK